MNIVMTGATSYIGRKLVKRLKEEGHKIYALVRKNSKIDKIKKDAELICCTPYLELYEQMKNIYPDIYINLAGYYCGSHTPEQISMLCEGNFLLPVYVTDAVSAAGCRYIIHTSSVQQCYLGEQYNPLNLYAATKQSFEDVLQYYTSVQKVCAVVLQLFDTYGADDDRNKVFNYIRRMKEGEELAMSPGDQKMYFCYIDDVVEAFIRGIFLVQQQPEGFLGKYAVRGETPISLKEFAESYIGYTKRKIFPQWGKRNYMVREIMNPSGYGETLPGWKPKISYQQGIKLCGDYDLKHIEHIG